MYPIARRCAVTVALLGLVTVASCGGSDDETSGTTSPSAETTVPSAETTVPSTETSVATEGSTTASAAGDFSEEQYVDAAAGVINLGDREQARCLAQAVVDAVGVENLQGAGVTPEEFAQTGNIRQLGIPLDTAAADLQAGFTQCGDLVQAAIDASQLVDPQAACLREFFDNELFAETIIVDLLEVEASQALNDARTNAQQCAAE